jgi:hypothetical protein
MTDKARCGPPQRALPPTSPCVKQRPRNNSVPPPHIKCIEQGPNASVQRIRSLLHNLQFRKDGMPPYFIFLGSLTAPYRT